MLQKGIVRKRTRSFYYVDCEGDTRLCRVKGNLFQESRYDEKIAVGDMVEIDLDAPKTPVGYTKSFLEKVGFREIFLNDNWNR